ncbi:nucleoside triphosphate pyrophosphohydrolase [Pacificimonas flava]|uniref:Nucleoside triphosphate pyrophosphohydrolase n=2 Tax=Pacificimonas TaxID=1960290 RepID=A0A219B8W9_9SPHN|nr:nucleoside triphosphate pyrophosphohydrolase [Pacificimonas aurantium]OWV34208.1 nucleoside triphosphate pyrophosphohydrolase [Pacificimonas flava]
MPHRDANRPSDPHLSEADERLAAQVVRLRAVMAALRHPETGCPWDLDQDFTSIAPYTIEEAYEVADAIERGDIDDLRGELGDLLLQTVYHSRLAEEAGTFDLADVTAGIADKMIARHPHVFGEENVATADAQTENWEVMKARERGNVGALDGVALALPALMRAQKLQKRAARTGFDWPDSEGPRAKILEEMAELEAASTAEEREEEAGDLLFAVVNFIRHVGVDAEVALRAANSKFQTRFEHMESTSTRPLAELDFEALERLWVAAKVAERQAKKS